MRRLILILTTCAAGCGASSSWHLDSIATGEPRFDSSLLYYATPSSHLKIEFLRIADQIHAFLYLDRFQMTPLPNEPAFTAVHISIGEETWMEKLPLREGKMKASFSEETTARVILALQEGKEVAILVNGASQTLTPGGFSEMYPKFLKKQTIFSNLFRGPLE